MIANVRRRAISWDKLVMKNPLNLTTKRAPWSLADLIQLRPPRIKPGHLGFGGGELGDESRRFLRTGNVETGFVQGVLQFSDTRFRSQHGRFHSVQLALLFETQLALTRWLSNDCDRFHHPYRRPLALLALLQVVGIVTGLD